MLVHYFASEGWQTWGLGGQPLIPERMPVLIDDDFLFEDESGPRATRAVNGWLRSLLSSGTGTSPAPPVLAALEDAAGERLRQVFRDAFDGEPPGVRLRLVTARAKPRPRSSGSPTGRTTCS